MSHLAKKPISVQTRWASFENPLAQKGAGGLSNHGAKGHPCIQFMAHETVTLMEYSGAGEIRRIWMTLQNRTDAALRAITLRCYWDGSEKPAVEAPLGDFMCQSEKEPRWESELFASPEGRSFNCYIPMPFKMGAKITLTNESDCNMGLLFYDVDFLTYAQPQEDLLYFHSFYHRTTAVPVGQDYEILPEVTGTGRFLGVSFTVNANPLYGSSWWGEGEVKTYLDGDRDIPTLVGTGTEDYIGTAWGQGEFYGRYQGCLLADSEALRWKFYRFHVCDPVYWQENIRVTIQDMGGDTWPNALAHYENGVPMIPVTCDGGLKGMQYLYDPSVSRHWTADNWPKDGWVNFYRSDDFASVAYFYLDTPASDLPAIQDMNVRMDGLKLESSEQRDVLLETV